MPQADSATPTPHPNVPHSGRGTPDLSDSVLAPRSHRQAFITPSALVTLVTWGTLGFRELQYRAANSRYLAGRENPDCAVARPPDGPHGPAATPTKAR